MFLFFVLILSKLIWCALKWHDVNEGKQPGNILLNLYSYKELKLAKRWLIKQTKTCVITYNYNKIMVQITHIVVFDVCMYMYVCTSIRTIYFTNCSNWKWFRFQLFERTICFYIEYIIYRYYLLPSRNVLITHNVEVYPQENKWTSLHTPFLE